MQKHSLVWRVLTEVHEHAPLWLPATYVAKRTDKENNSYKNPNTILELSVLAYQYHRSPFGIPYPNFELFSIPFLIIKSLRSNIKLKIWYNVQLILFVIWTVSEFI